MPNRNYLNGRSREYRIQNKLRQQGYIVLRCRGSHGFADLIAINKAGHKIRFIQVKPKSMGPKAMERIFDANAWAHGNFECSFEVISKLKLNKKEANGKSPT